MGTRSYVIGNPTWSNLISLNFKGSPVIGLANFPILKKYYLILVIKMRMFLKVKKKEKSQFLKIYLSSK